MFFSQIGIMGFGEADHRGLYYICNCESNNYFEIKIKMQLFFKGDD